MADGTIERCKARLVAKGYSQVDCFDCQEMFSPEAKQATMRIFLALVVVCNWHLY